jgi:hypothetical protein
VKVRHESGALEDEVVVMGKSDSGIGLIQIAIKVRMKKIRTDYGPMLHAQQQFSTV